MLPTDQELTISIERAKDVLRGMIDGSSDPKAKRFYKFQLEFYESWNRYLVGLARELSRDEVCDVLPGLVAWFADQGFVLLGVDADSAARESFFNACAAFLRRQRAMGYLEVSPTPDA